MGTFKSEDEARQKIVDTALGYVGVREGTNAHKKIIDAYNAVSPRPRGYKVQYTDAWCATFVTFIFDRVGISNLIERECGCQEMINKCAKRNLIDYTKKSVNITAKGNIVFYDWENNGHSDHVGIIKGVSQNNIEVIEGNYQDQVKIRTISSSSSSICCVLTPHYETLVQVPQYDYQNIGWNKDETGWWYTYSHNKGEYYRNCFKEIDREIYAFNSAGYVCNPNKCELTEKGGILNVEGEIYV